jgi:hypothetical protein
MNLESVRRDDWILGGVALLLIIDLLAFPWISYFIFSSTATGAPDAWAAILALIAALALLADLALERLSPEITVPTVGGSRTMTRFVLAIVVAVFVALKFLLYIHFSLFDWGFYLGVILTVALVYLTLQARNAPDVPVARPPVGSAGPPPA